MEEKSKPKFYLKWPWNLVVYIALILVLRIFAIPVILVLSAWNKKQQPDGPAEGYCLQRTRGQLKKLWVSGILLFLGLLMGAYFVGCIIFEDFSTWEGIEYGTWIFSGIVTLLMVGLGGYLAFLYLRDAFCPEKSRLAQSIRDQLPYPEEAPPVAELFAMVDEDIKANGQWFDQVAVGRKWILGDDVTALDRVRVVAGRDEIERHTSGGRVRVTRYLELHILDDRRQTQITTLRDPKELPMILECLRLRVPEAIFCSYSDFNDYSKYSDADWRELEHQYQARKAQRADREYQKEKSAAGTNAHFILTDLRGLRSSRVDRAAVETQLAGLSEYGQHFGVELIEPLPAGQAGCLTQMGAGLVEQGLVVTAVFRQKDGTYRGWGLTTTAQQAGELFGRLLDAHQPPDLTGWEPLRAVDEPEEERPRVQLTLRETSGACRDYDFFTRRDLELAGEGLNRGRYSEVTLLVSPWYLQILAGDASDARFTARCNNPAAGQVELYETKCTDGQARQWLLDLGDGRFRPDLGQWKNITKQVLAELKKKDKAKAKANSNT